MAPLTGTQMERRARPGLPRPERQPLAHRNIARRVFKAILEKAGLPDEFKIYSLRHTMATLLLQGGENSKVVQERMGHASIVQTHDTYTHVLPTVQQAAASKMEAIMFGRREAAGS